MIGSVRPAAGAAVRETLSKEDVAIPRRGPLQTGALLDRTPIDCKGLNAPRDRKNRMAARRRFTMRSRAHGEG
jgi:hypothetical protein